MPVEAPPGQVTAASPPKRRLYPLALSTAMLCAAGCLRLESSISRDREADNCGPGERCNAPQSRAPGATLTGQPSSSGTIISAEELAPPEPSPLCPNPMPSTCSVAPAELLAERCAGASCHGTPDSPPPKQVDLLSTPEQLFARLSRSYGNGSCAEYLVVDDRQPEQSLLLNKLGAAVPVCGQPMPVGAVLTPDELICLTDWLKAAATCR